MASKSEPRLHSVKLDELREAEYNPRMMTEEDERSLTASLEKFKGAIVDEPDSLLVEPLIVNRHPDRFNVIVGGHQRVFIARKLGWKTLEARFVSLPLDMEKELNLRLNRNLGRWDWRKLLDEFDTSFLLEIGFDQLELALPDFNQQGDDTNPQDLDTNKAYKYTINCSNVEEVNRLVEWLGTEQLNCEFVRLERAVRSGRAIPEARVTSETTSGD